MQRPQCDPYTALTSLVGSCIFLVGQAQAWMASLIFPSYFHLSGNPWVPTYPESAHPSGMAALRLCSLSWFPPFGLASLLPQLSQAGGLGLREGVACRPAAVPCSSEQKPSLGGHRPGVSASYSPHPVSSTLLLLPVLLEVSRHPPSYRPLHGCVPISRFLILLPCHHLW